MKGVLQLSKKIGLFFTLLLLLTFITACGVSKSNNNNANDNENNNNQTDNADEVEASEVEENNTEEAAVNKEGFPIVDKEIELTLMAPGTGLAEWEDMPTLQAYEDITNIKFQYKTPPMDDFETNLNLAFASGDIADIIYAAGSDNLTSAMEVDYGEQGILLPLEDLIDDYAPNLKKIFEENPDIKKSVTTLDGHIYSLPRISDDVWYRGPIWYNGEWLDALGVDELPETVDEFYDLLVRFRDEDPNGNGEADEIPISDHGMDGLRTFLLGAFGIKSWGIEEVDGIVRYAPITDNYKGYLEYMNKLYEEKLLDSEIFSQSDDQKKAKGQNNQIGVFTDFYSFFTTGETEEEALNNPLYMPLTSEWTDEPLLPKNPGLNRGTFSITADNPNPEASIRWVDYFYSPEGNAFINDGPEGIMWEWDENEEMRLELPVPDKFDSREDWRGTLTPNYGILAPSLAGPIEGAEQSKFDQFIDDETDEKYTPYAEVPFPLVYLTKEEQKEVNDIQVDVQSYVEQMEAKFITGVEPLDNWDKYVETIEKMDIDRYVEIQQEAYDRWNEG